VGGSAGGLAKGSAGGGKPVDFENFWEAPAFMWKHPEVTEREIEAVMVSFSFGALALLLSSVHEARELCWLVDSMSGLRSGGNVALEWS